MKSEKKILAFARETGGAAAIAPVCKGMTDLGWKVLLLTKDNGLKFFKKKDFNYVNFPNFDSNRLEELSFLEFGSLPDLIFTSATSLPFLDMTERYLWEWGKQKDIPTVGVLDQWQNYSLRFSGCSHEEHLKYIPDNIFVMDALAKKEMIQAGLPEQNIVITGQPAFEVIVNECKKALLKVEGIKKQLNLAVSEIVVTFIAESFKNNFGDTLGYDEQSTLMFLGETLATFVNLPIFLLVRLHPENVYEEFSWVMNKWPALRKKIIIDELTPCETVQVSDLVVGMSSILLIEAIIANKIVLSLQLNSKIPSQLAATKAGAIPFVVSEDDARQKIKDLLFKENYKRDYLRNQQSWDINFCGSENSLKKLETILNV